MLQAAGEVVVASEGMGDAHGHTGDERVGCEHGISLSLALAVMRVEEPGPSQGVVGAVQIRGALGCRGPRARASRRWTSSRTGGCPRVGVSACCGV